MVLKRPGQVVTANEEAANLIYQQFAQSAQAERRNVSCSNEVILAAGAIFTPTLLQVSGIGPESVLNSLNVQVKSDLPGVGANFQDHGMLHPVYSCKSRSTPA